ncbi:hypothetical protein GUITHDRAFT_118287 [Guillardia theta CCMP2712]|uniref:Uncharacterized protein n=1 Tax=Guillardia theta (strain CCMP2712) TaxID=905079 RepID=L1II12_GUITC|nr:hypothetical protein GUITHDRAFT_118287 [Guillardia theta CCMP2712]EKX35584.1 hypothetical protein GUITHDRAFT_118287 [Guillardia theta CCMP2712]|eukprot:XP_005822564.1 hypothetical protein GUITHDRAFT_118287 [Guillardia theta CCMP2712]
MTVPYRLPASSAQGGSAWIQSAVKISSFTLLVSIVLFVSLNAGPRDVSLLSGPQHPDSLDASAQVLHDWLLKRAFAKHKTEREIHEQGLDEIATKILKSLVARKKIKSLARTSALVSDEHVSRGRMYQSSLYHEGSTRDRVARPSIVKALFGRRAEDEQRDRMLHRLRMLEKAVRYVKEDQSPEVRRKFIQIDNFKNADKAINKQEEAVRRKEDDFVNTLLQKNFETFDQKLGFGVDNVVNHYYRHIPSSHSWESPMNSTAGDAVDFLSNSAGKGGSKIVITLQGGEDQSSDTPEIVIGVKRRAAAGTSTSVLSQDESCPCLDTFTYKSSIYSGCIATDGWDRPWCATEGCGTCGNSMISSSCWKFCGTFDETPPKAVNSKDSKGPELPRRAEKQPDTEPAVSTAESGGPVLSPAVCKRDAGKFFCKTDLICVISCEGCTDLPRGAADADGNICSPALDEKTETTAPAAEESRQEDGEVKEESERRGTAEEKKPEHAEEKEAEQEPQPPSRNKEPEVQQEEPERPRKKPQQDKQEEEPKEEEKSKEQPKEERKAPEEKNAAKEEGKEEKPKGDKPREAEASSEGSGGSGEGREPEARKEEEREDQSGRGGGENMRPLTYSSMLPLQRAAWRLQEEARHLSTEQEELRDAQQKARSIEKSIVSTRKELSSREMDGGSVGNGWTLTFLSFGIAILALLIMAAVVAILVLNRSTNVVIEK